MADNENIMTELMPIIQAYELPEEATSIFREISHDKLVDATNQFLFHHGILIGINGWGDNIHCLRDGGVDSIWSFGGEKSDTKLGIQVKSHSDFNNIKNGSFRKSVLAQIAESRQMGLSNLLLGLCADLSSSSQLQKCRGILADVAKMTDDYVVPISPTKMAGIWKWSQGLQTALLDQIREAGYAWLTAIYDSLGNLNQNSWGKGTGGGWSNSKTTTLRVGQNINFRAIGLCGVSSELEYQYSVQRSGRSFEVRRDWLDDPLWTWVVEESDIGRHVCVMISVRRKKNYYQFADSDDYTYAIYDVLPMSLS